MFLRMIPSGLTIGNLVLGLLAIVMSAEGDTSKAALMVVIGMVLDGLDGRVARWLQAESEFGKQLDSLADLVTFGVAPAWILYQTILGSLGVLGMMIGLLFPVCGALRLARFNVQRKSFSYFVGLPITAAGGILATMSLYENILNPSDVILPVSMVILSSLMVSRVRYPNFKKLAFPKSAVIVVPLLAALVYVLFRIHAVFVNWIVFVAIAMYALYGVTRAARAKRIAKAVEAEKDTSQSVIK